MCFVFISSIKSQDIKPVSGTSGKASYLLRYSDNGGSICLQGQVKKMDSTNTFTTTPINSTLINGKTTINFAYKITDSLDANCLDTITSVIYSYYDNKVYGIAIDTLSLIGSSGSVKLTLSGNAPNWYFTFKDTNKNAKGRNLYFYLDSPEMSNSLSPIDFRKLIKNY